MPEMNDFAARKFGEVLAFAETFNDTVDRALEAIGKERSDEQIQQLKDTSTDHANRIKAIVLAAGTSESTLKKAEATNKKLRTMRDTYIGDSWDELTEIYEWLGFFTGAAIVHWALIEGVGESLEDDETAGLVKDAKEFYQQLMNDSIKHLQLVGRNRTGD
ncbi:hypothetical protein EPO04_00125 [Patescibacteria group bacterium]|nr:MAG: hypothetical protein EPO04_00125 [Patescibacteria group bacterium]